MKFYKTFLIAVLFVIVNTLALMSCTNKSVIAVKGTDDILQLDTITIGTHQYLYGVVKGRYGPMLCHYEDCNNPIHHSKKDSILTAHN